MLFLFTTFCYLACTLVSSEVVVSIYPQSVKVFNNFYRCLHSMRSRVYVTVGCPSLCPIDRQQQRRPASLLLSVMQAGDIDRWLRARCRRQRSAANASSVVLRADE